MSRRGFGPWLVALTLLVGALTPVLASSAVATLASPLTAAYLRFSDHGEESTTDVTVVEASPSQVQLRLASPLTGTPTDLFFTPPPGSQLSTGTFEDATAWYLPEAGRAGFGIRKGSYGGCDAGRFVVDQVSFSGASLTAFSARFQSPCAHDSAPWVGAVSYQATADFRTASHTTQIEFANTALGTTSATSPFTVTNNGPSTLTITAASLGGPDGSQFAIASNGCTSTLAAGQSCTIELTFSPVGSDGYRVATIGLTDELAPVVGAPLTFPVQGYAFVAPPPPDPTGEYTALTPARILDTRGDAGVTCNKSLTKLGAAQTFTVQVGGCGNVPTSGVAAVVMNVTVTEPTGSSYLTVYPSGISRPIISNLNYLPGQTVPNSATVKLGAGGMVNVYNNVGSAHVVIDVVGYYSTKDGPLGLRYHGSNGTRLVDTRPVNYPIKAGEPFVRPVYAYDQNGAGVNGVKAVVLNVTVTEPNTSGHLTIYPHDVGKPLASSLNFTPGLTVANLVIVRVPADNRIVFENSAGQLHLVVDVVGWFDENTTTEAGRFIPYDPFRRVDTRTLTPPLRLDAGDILVVPMIPAPGLPSTLVEAMVLNVTVTQLTSPGYLTAYPDNEYGPPGTSTLNFIPGHDIPNGSMTRIGNGSVAFYSAFGPSHVVVDVFGYFTGPANPFPTDAQATTDAIEVRPSS
jgi:hypothetical protein